MGSRIGDQPAVAGTLLMSVSFLTLMLRLGRDVNCAQHAFFL